MDRDDEDLKSDRNEKQDFLAFSSSGLDLLLDGDSASIFMNLFQLGILISSSGSPRSLSTNILTSPTRFPSTCLLVDTSLNLCLPLTLIFRPTDLGSSLDTVLSSVSIYSNISAVVPTKPFQLVLSAFKLTTPNIFVVSITVLEIKVTKPIFSGVASFTSSY